MTDDMTSISLDDLYSMTAFIYGDRNSTRTKEATFAHFVEVCGMLTLVARSKKRDSFDVADALCKALGWYFPLLAKLRVRSVEDLVYRKFPNVCPYCRKSPHDEVECKQVKGTEKTVNHSEVARYYRQNMPTRPVGLNEWQAMFHRIYPRNMNEGSRSVLGLMEELGELSEAIRVFDAHPHYFLGEAADIFSYLMGLANEFSLQEAVEGRKFDFQREYVARYPGLCPQCGSRVCVCPAIPAATIGRMAKEIEIGATESPFENDGRAFAERGKRAATQALESAGGYSGLATRLPFDRGDVNHALVQLCLRIADAVDATNPQLAGTLRAEAIKLGELARDAGTATPSGPPPVLFENLRSVWREIDPDHQNKVRESAGMTGELVELIDSVRALFVYSNPVLESGELDLQSERRSVREALRRGKYATRFQVKDLPAATRDDLRRELLENEFDIVQFSGHSDPDFLVFVDENQNAVDVPMRAVMDLLAAHASIKCVVLTSCESGAAMQQSIADFTVVMDEAVDDDVARTYSIGFFEALVSGRKYDEAHAHALRAVNLAGLDGRHIRLLTRN